MAENARAVEAGLNRVACLQDARRQGLVVTDMKGTTWTKEAAPDCQSFVRIFFFCLNFFTPPPSPLPPQPLNFLSPTIVPSQLYVPYLLSSSSRFFAHSCSFCSATSLNLAKPPSVSLLNMHLLFGRWLLCIVQTCNDLHTEEKSAS